MNHLLIIVGLVFSSVNLSVQTYSLDTEQSTIKWQGSAAVVAYSVDGIIQPLEGQLQIEGERIVKGEIAIDMTSLSSEIPKLAKHLRSSDFFNVNVHKKASFKLIESAGVINNKVVLRGIFNIKNKIEERTVALNVTEIAGGFTLSGVISLDRTNYGIIYNSNSFFDDLKDNAISDDFTLEMNLVFQ